MKKETVMFCLFLSICSMMLWNCDVSGSLGSSFASVSNSYDASDEQQNDLTGEGSLLSPYLIGSQADLAQLVQHTNDGDTKNKYYKLNDNISLNGSFSSIGTKDNPFEGNFYGYFKKISISEESTQDKGLFGHIKGATVSSFSVEGLNIVTTEKNDAVGIVAAVATDSTISHVTVLESSVEATSSTNVGGLVGKVAGGTIKNCLVEGSKDNTDKIEGKSHVGGLVGAVENEDEDGDEASISSSRVVSMAVEGRYLVGGVIGLNSGTVSSSFAKYTLVGPREYKEDAYYTGIGGFVGTNRDGGSISKSAVLSVLIEDDEDVTAIKGTSNVGGFAGDNEGTIAECFVTAALGVYVEGKSSDSTGAVGGFVGYAAGGKITESGADILVKDDSGQKHVGSFVGMMGACSITDSYWNEDKGLTPSSEDQSSSRSAAVTENQKSRISQLAYNRLRMKKAFSLLPHLQQ